jgi:MFS transporter, putative metabolite:H+ symporter
MMAQAEEKAAGRPGDMRDVAARVERLPYCSWHWKMRAVIGTAWFFDAFDSVAIAYVLPPLIGAWHLGPEQIGSMIGIAFAGQLVGALSFGMIGERWGRRNTLVAGLLIFTLASLACAFAKTYYVMFWLRFVEGIGLGGEVPLMAAYINEFAKAKGRGRFSLNVQVLFAIGLPAVAAVGAYVVPRWGWPWMFLIGAVPAVVAIPMVTVLPESVRWLASQGRFGEADRALKRIEDIARAEGKILPPLPVDLPAPATVRPRIGELFKGIYLRRTISVWFIWVGAYFVSYGLGSWAPSLFKTVYHLSVQTSLNYTLIYSLVGLGSAGLTVYLIEAIGRRRMLIASLGLCSLPLLAFAVVRQPSAEVTLALISAGFFPLGFSLLGLATYTAEIYPTHLRALGGGVASAWQRAASMVGTTIVGWILPAYGINAVFVLFGCFALMGAVVAFFFAIETRAQLLERLSPA